jgi:hypothetical protein
LGISGVVVAKEHEVEARYFAGYLQRGVFRIVGRGDAPLAARMEKSDKEVDFFFLAQRLRPLACGGEHVVESQSAPQPLRQPIGYGGCYQSEDADFHAVALDNGIRFEIGFPGGKVDDVGPQRGAVQLGNPFVIDLVPGLHVVVADALRVVSQIVYHLGPDVVTERVEIVGVVRNRLSLQDVTVLEQDEVLAVCGSLSFEIAAHACHRSGHWFPVDEIVWEKCPVHIRCLYDFQGYRLVFGHSSIENAECRETPCE